MSAHKAWALRQQRRKEFVRRQWILMASWIPMFGAFALLILESESEHSLFSLLPMVGPLTEIKWLGLWAAVLLLCGLFQVVLARLFWRCPACERFLGGTGIGKYCPHCGCHLSDTEISQY